MNRAQNMFAKCSLKLIEPRTQAEVNVFSSRRGDDCNSLPQNGDRCIMAPFYEIGRIFIRFHSVHPQKENRLVGLLMIQSQSSHRTLLSHGVIYPLVL